VRPRRAAVVIGEARALAGLLGALDPTSARGAPSEATAMGDSGLIYMLAFTTFALVILFLTDRRRTHMTNSRDPATRRCGKSSSVEADETRRRIWAIPA
jgi:hypothetical protein